MNCEFIFKNKMEQLFEKYELLDKLYYVDSSYGPVDFKKVKSDILEAFDGYILIKKRDLTGTIEDIMEIFYTNMVGPGMYQPEEVRELLKKYLIDGESDESRDVSEEDVLGDDEEVLPHQPDLFTTN